MQHPIGKPQIFSNVQSSSHNEKIKPELDPKFYKTHIFYYIWYGNIENDGKFVHWNHKVLEHWTPEVNTKFPNIGSTFDPLLEDIGANFYPWRGLYSSRSREIIRDHFRELEKYQIYTVVVSWWGIDSADENGIVSNDIMPILFEIAEEMSIKIIFHLEPYPGRDALSTKKDIIYIIDKFGSSSSLFKMNGKPLFYVYDSYLTPASEWEKVLSKKGKHSIRGTKYDSIFIGLYLNQQTEKFIIDGHFDGIYTYFASTGFTYGSTPQNWKAISDWCKKNNKIFIPSVGPGYDDTRIRPWNAKNKKDRRNGEYYDQMWKSAIELDVPFISITSYNEWHEGTQIEPSIPKISKTGFQYSDFSPNSHFFYLEKTRDWIKKYIK